MIRNTFAGIALAAALAIGLPMTAQAAVIVDTPLGSTIDPAATTGDPSNAGTPNWTDEDVDFAASNATPMATLNARSDLKVIQDWAGAEGGTDNFRFTDPGLVAVRISTSFSTIYTGANDTGPTFRTSPGGENYAWVGTDGQTITIEFGSHDGTVGGFTPDAAVQAAGLTFVNFGNAYNTASDQIITYYDPTDQILSTQVFAGSGPDADYDPGFTGNEFYTGYESDSQNIAKIVINISRASGSSDVALDDLAFAVPEPASLTLLCLGGVAVLIRKRK